MSDAPTPASTQSPATGPAQAPSRRPRLVITPARALRAVAVLAAFAACVWLGGHPRYLPAPLRSLTGAAEPAASRQASRVSEVLSDISRYYWRTPDSAALQDAAIRAAVGKLSDPFSRYVPPAARAEFDQETSGSYAGVGVVEQPKSDGVHIEQVIAGGPAAKAGLRAGEVIVAVDGRPLTGLTAAEQAAAEIRGPAGTKVTLRIRGHGRVTVTRQTLKAPLTTTKTITVKGRRVAVIHLSEFAQGAAQAVGAAVRQADRRHAQGIVLDLRENPGGLVSEAVSLVSEFVRSGKVVTLRARMHPNDPQILTVTGHPIDTTTPLVVLVNRDTASAAEITTAALRDDHRAVVTGTRTYGKGVFQQTFPLASGGLLDITVGSYYTPAGVNLGGGGPKLGAGITPDIRTADTAGAKADRALATAAALAAAGH
jgi:carboxyl-terminal processing protease